MIDTMAVHSAIASIYAAVFSVPFVEFRSQVMQHLRELIPFDSAVWAAGVHETNQVLDFELVNQEPALIAQYVFAYAESDLVRTHSIANPGKAFRIEDTRTLEEYRALPVYQEFGRRLGIEHALGAAALDPATKLQELIALWRADRDSPFSEAERDMHALMVPHMLNAWRNRQAVHVFETAMARPGAQHLQQRFVAIINKAGLLHAADAGFGTLIAEKFPGWEGPQLPDAIVGEFMAENQYFSVNNLDFSITTGEPRNIIVACRASRAKTLTPAETRTVHLFIEGNSASSIAKSLGISASTVRNQIASAYAKLEVHSKVALAKVMGSV